MPYKLWPPGTRKGNRTWLARGSVDGRRFEKILEAKTRPAAEAEAERFIGTLRAPGPDAVVTFEVAATAYMDGKDLGSQDIAYLERLKAHFRGMPVGDIIGAHLTTAAHALASNTSNANKNRAVITPASSVLHFASEQGWCQERRFRRLPVSRRSNRKPVPAGTMQMLLANTDGLERLFLAWLYETGQRITASLGLMREDLDLARRMVKVTSDKTDDHGQIEISAELAAMLARDPGTASGRVFPWGDRHNVYRWLKPLCARLKVSYTPHQSRGEIDCVDWTAPDNTMSHSDRLNTIALYAARAAIEAMREPTEGMLEAAATCFRPTGRRRTLGDILYVEYRAAIDAALSPSTKD